MTKDLTSDLERLKEADPATWQAINFFSKGLQGFDIDENPNKLVKGDIVQCCIQRACEKYGWPLSQHQWNGKCAAAIRIKADVKPIIGYGDMPAQAILRAYLEAIKQ